MRGRADKGTILPIVAMSMLGILAIVAIVIDLGATRSLRRDARSATDAGATAGALGIASPTPGSECTDAFAYTFKDLGGTQPTAASISTACTGLTATCSGTTSRVASLTISGTTVRVTNPVPDGDPLMQGTSEGSGVTQAVNATADGAPCDRVGVEVTQSQPAFFRGAVGGGAATYTVHSVAKYYPELRNVIIPPALVALNQTTCNAINAGSNGNIVLVANSVGPGIAYSDSDGSAGCSSSNPILASKSSARLVAESFGSVVGQLGWYSAPTSIGYNGSSSTNQTPPASFATTTENYVGELYARTQRTTRVPIDKRYHCTNVSTTVQPLCSTPDPIASLQSLSASSATSAPGGYTVYSGPCDTTSAAITFPSGNLWVNCPTFTVKGNSLTIPGGGTVIFNGALSVEANGTLLSNTSGALDANGYPIANDTTKDTTLLINSTGSSAFNIVSNSSSVIMAQTTVYNSGGFTLSSSQSIHWTPPAAGNLLGLLYWSESTQQFSIQGGPQIKARGIMFHGNGQLTGGGGGTIDLTHVQMWVDTMSTGGSTTVKISADPNSAINVYGAGSALIR
jgi:hypothetical protein